MNVTKTLTIKSTITGAEQTAAGLQQVASAQTGVASASEQATKSTLSSEKALERLQRSLDQAYRAQKQFEQATKDLDRAQEQGRLSTQRHLELLDLATKRFRDTTDAANGLGRGVQSPTEAFDKLRGRLDLAHRAQAEFKKSTDQLDAANKAGLISASQHLQLLQVATQRYRNVTLAQNQFGKSIGLSAGAMQNMSFQLNDIATGLAMGQSPFQIMVQQGGQVLQILQMHEGGVGGSLRAIKNALLDLPTPIKALGLGFTAVTAAAAGFWFLVRDNSKGITASLEEHARLMDVIKKAYSGAADQAARFFAQGKDQTIFELMRNAENLKVNLEQLIQRATRQMTTPTALGMPEMGIAPDAQVIAQQFSAFRKVIDDFLDTVRAGKPDLDKFRENIAQIGIDQPGFSEVAARLLEIAKEAAGASTALNLTTASMNYAKGTASEAELAFLRLHGVIKDVKQQLDPDPMKEFGDAISALQKLGGEVGFPGLKELNEVAAAQDAFNRGLVALNAAAALASMSVDDYNARLKFLTDTLNGALAGIKANNAAQVGSVNAYDSLIQRTRDRIEELRLENSILVDNERQVTKLKFINQAERAAASAGVSVDRKEVELLGEQLAIEEKISKERQRQRDFNKEVFQSFESGISGFITDLAQGVELSEALSKNLENVAKSLIQAGSAQISKTLMTSFGELLGGGFGGGIGGGLAGIGIGIGIQMLSKMFGDNGKAAEEAAKKLEQAKAAWAGMQEQAENFIASAQGLTKGRAASELLGLFNQLDDLMIAAFNAQDFAGYNRVVTAFQEGLVRIRNEFLGGTEDMGEFEGQLHDAMLEAQSFQQALVAVGLSLEDATAIAAAGLARMQAAIQSQATQQVIADINELSGVGWINELQAVLRQFVDFQAAGVEGGMLQNWLALTAQSVVNSAELTGQQFQALLAIFPQLTGVVHEFNAALDETTAAAIAATRAQLQLRLLRATTDTGTLAGALSVFDLQAQIELAQARADPLMTANLPLLEAAIAAERLQIIRNFQQQAIAEERRAAEERQRALEEAQQTLDAFTRSVDEFIAHLLAGSESPLSPQARLASAQQAFAQQVSIIQTGTPEQIRAAMNTITSFAQDVLEANRLVNASSVAGQQIFESVVSTLESLPAQISVQELILQATETQTTAITGSISTLQSTLTSVLDTGDLDAIRLSLASFLPQIDTNTDNAITFAELQTALGGTYSTGTLRGIFNELDGNGNGILEKNELIAANTFPIGDVATDTNSMVTSLLALAQISSNTGTSAVANSNMAVDIDQMNSTMSTMSNNIAQINTNTLDTEFFVSAMRSMMQFQNANWSSAPPVTPLPVFEQGGIFRTGTSSVGAQSGIAMLHNQEYVVNRASTMANLPLLHAINNARGPLDFDDLRQEIAALRKIVWAAGRHVREGVDIAADRNENEQRRMAVETRQIANRPRGNGRRNIAA